MALATVAAALGTGALMMQGKAQSAQQRTAKEGLELQKKANEEAKERAQEAKDRSDIEINKANKKTVDVAAIRSKEEQAALSGPAGTMLTGNQGVNPDNLTLGGNTLLGG